MYIAGRQYPDSVVALSCSGLPTRHVRGKLPSCYNVCIMAGFIYSIGATGARVAKKVMVRNNLNPYRVVSGTFRGTITITVQLMST